MMASMTLHLGAAVLLASSQGHPGPSTTCLLPSFPFLIFRSLPTQHLNDLFTPKFKPSCTAFCPAQPLFRPSPSSTALAPLSYPTTSASNDLPFCNLAPSLDGIQYTSEVGHEKQVAFSPSTGIVTCESSDWASVLVP